MQATLYPLFYPSLPALFPPSPHQDRIVHTLRDAAVDGVVWLLPSHTASQIFAVTSSYAYEEHVKFVFLIFGEICQVSVVFLWSHVG